VSDQHRRQAHQLSGDVDKPNNHAQRTLSTNLLEPHFTSALVPVPHWFCCCTPRRNYARLAWRTSPSARVTWTGLMAWARCSAAPHPTPITTAAATATTATTATATEPQVRQCTHEHTCACMCVWAHKRRICAQMRMCTHTYAHTRIFTHTHKRMRAQSRYQIIITHSTSCCWPCQWWRTCTAKKSTFNISLSLTHTHTHTHAYTHLYKLTHTRTHTHTYTHTRTRTYTYTHKHTHIHTQVSKTWIFHFVSKWDTTTHWAADTVNVVLPARYNAAGQTSHDSVKRKLCSYQNLLFLTTLSLLAPLLLFVWQSTLSGIKGSRGATGKGYQ